MRPSAASRPIASRMGVLLTPRAAERCLSSRRSPGDTSPSRMNSRSLLYTLSWSVLEPRLPSSPCTSQILPASAGSWAMAYPRTSEPVPTGSGRERAALGLSAQALGVGPSTRCSGGNAVTSSRSFVRAVAGADRRGEQAAHEREDLLGACLLRIGKPGEHCPVEEHREEAGDCLKVDAQFVPQRVAVLLVPGADKPARRLPV